MSFQTSKPLKIKLILAVILLILSMQAPVLADDIGYGYAATGSIKQVRTYMNEKGKFCMEMEAVGLENGDIDACLINESGVVIDRWSTLNHVNSSASVKYVFSRDYSATPTGIYTMVLTHSTLWGSQSWSFGIRHTQKAAITLKESFKAKQDDGSYVHKLVFDLNGAKDKTIYCEIYTKDGKLLRQYSNSAFPYGSGKWTIRWDYFPTKGLKVNSGEYMIKYWIKDGTSKQATIQVQI